MIRAANGIASPAVFGKPLPFHSANMCHRAAWTGSGSPSPCEALRATSQVAVLPSDSIRRAVTTVVASTRAFDRPVAMATPGSQTRHMSAGSPELLRKFTRVVTTSSPHTRATSCAYAVQPRCCSKAV